MNTSRIIWGFLSVTAVSVFITIGTAQAQTGGICDRTTTQKKYDTCITDKMASDEYQDLLKKSKAVSDELTAKNKAASASGRRVRLSRAGYGIGGRDRKEWNIDLVNAALWCEFPNQPDMYISTDECDAIPEPLKSIMNELISLDKQRRRLEAQILATRDTYQKDCIASKCMVNGRDQCAADTDAQAAAGCFQLMRESLRSPASSVPVLRNWVQIVQQAARPVLHLLPAPAIPHFDPPTTAHVPPTPLATFVTPVTEPHPVPAPLTTFVYAPPLSHARGMCITGCGVEIAACLNANCDLQDDFAGDWNAYSRGGFARCQAACSHAATANSCNTAIVSCLPGR